MGGLAGGCNLLVAGKQTVEEADTLVDVAWAACEAPEPRVRQQEAPEPEASARADNLGAVLA